jgi:molybdate transport system regulatory protein
VQPRVKLWVEKDGLLVFSDYRAELLDHIAKTGSISGGADRMGLSYRRAWGKIKEIEQNLGVRLVQSEVGGLGGGRTKLTPEGEEMLARYGAFRAAAQSHVGQDFAETLGRSG